MAKMTIKVGLEDNQMSGTIKWEVGEHVYTPKNVEQTSASDTPAMVKRYVTERMGQLIEAAVNLRIPFEVDTYDEAFERRVKASIEADRAKREAEPEWEAETREDKARWCGDESIYAEEVAAE